jgi:hypothetical protein
MERGMRAQRGRRGTAAYVSIRQHTSAYVSIRQHTSAYVSVRQRTSAYVSIRQHTYAKGECERKEDAQAYTVLLLLGHAFRNLAILDLLALLVQKYKHDAKRTRSGGRGARSRKQMRRWRVHLHM